MMMEASRSCRNHNDPVWIHAALYWDNNNNRGDSRVLDRCIELTLLVFAAFSPIILFLRTGYQQCLTETARTIKLSPLVPVLSLCWHSLWSIALLHMPLTSLYPPVYLYVAVSLSLSHSLCVVSEYRSLSPSPSL